MPVAGEQRHKETVAYIGLGSNLGGREAMLEEALRCLREENNLEVRRTSSWYATKPVGGPEGQEEYLNGVIEIATSLRPEELLDRLLAIEDKLGRKRGQRWDSRCIDLDLLLYGEKIIRTEHLQLPHRLMHEREFVLRGLTEIAPEVKHPVFGKTARQMWQKVQEQGKGK